MYTVISSSEHPNLCHSSSHHIFQPHLTCWDQAFWVGFFQNLFGWLFTGCLEKRQGIFRCRELQILNLKLFQALFCYHFFLELSEGKKDVTYLFVHSTLPLPIFVDWRNAWNNLPTLLLLLPSNFHYHTIPSSHCPADKKKAIAFWSS